jgi:hypothetical protein
MRKLGMKVSLEKDFEIVTYIPNPSNDKRASKNAGIDSDDFDAAMDERDRKLYEESLARKDEEEALMLGIAQEEGLNQEIDEEFSWDNYDAFIEPEEEYDSKATLSIMDDIYGVEDETLEEMIFEALEDIELKDYEEQLKALRNAKVIARSAHPNRNKVNDKSAALVIKFENTLFRIEKLSEGLEKISARNYIEKHKKDYLQTGALYSMARVDRISKLKESCTDNNLLRFFDSYIFDYKLKALIQERDLKEQTKDTNRKRKETALKEKQEKTAQRKGKQLVKENAK